MSSLKDLKNNRKALFEKIAKQSVDFNTKTKKTYESKNEGFWQPNVDKVGNSTSIIRFLPVQDETEDNIVRLWRYAFQGPTKKWYIENSPHTLGNPDPTLEMNSELWNAGSDELDKLKKCPLRKQARDQGRKLEYIANILIVNDELEPTNNDKVFHFRFGKKIKDKLDAAMFPSEQDIKFMGAKKINPFDLWEGAPLILTIKKVSGFRNYDDSKMGVVSPVAQSDAEIDVVWKQTRSVMKYIQPDQFKTYEELKARLAIVFPEDEEHVTPQPSKEPKEAKARPAKAVPMADDDDSAEYDLQKLLNED